MRKMVYAVLVVVSLVVGYWVWQHYTIVPPPEVKGSDRSVVEREQEAFKPAVSPEERVLIPRSKEDERLTEALRKMVERQDEQLKQRESHLALYAEVADRAETEKQGQLSPPYTTIKVIDPDSWPEETTTSYIALLRDDGIVSAFQEVPTSESGDWNNSYTHYFDEHGDTVAFRRMSNFFNGGCAEVVAETSTYYYRAHELIAKHYDIVDGQGKKLDPGKCEFPYHHDYVIHPTLMALREAAGLTSLMK